MLRTPLHIALDMPAIAAHRSQLERESNGRRRVDSRMTTSRIVDSADFHHHIAGSVHSRSLPYCNSLLERRRCICFGGTMLRSGSRSMLKPGGAVVGPGAATNCSYVERVSVGAGVFRNGNDRLCYRRRQRYATDQRVARKSCIVNGSVEAQNGKEGWQKALFYQPNIIVSDISMPEMNGIDLCLKIKSD
ncbi:MAG: response regulator, partial [Cytophagaceae bacterium]